MPDKIKLDLELLSQVQSKFQELTPDVVDLSEIKEYEGQFNRLERIDCIDFEKLSMNTLRAMDLAADYSYVSKRFADYSHVQVDRVAAFLYFTEAPKYLQANGVKDSDAAKTKYVDQHETYTKVKDIRNSWLALYDWLLAKKEIFQQKHFLVKKRLDQEITTMKISGG